MFSRYTYLEGLTSLFGSNGKYLIDITGQIKDIEGNDIQYRRDDDGNKIVHCSGWNGERDYRVIDLVAIQFKSLRIPVEDYGAVIAFVIDGNKDNIHARNIGYRFMGGKLQYKPVDGFYYVPGLTSVAINDQGDVINVVKSTRLKLYKTKSQKIKNIKGGYFTFSANISKGKNLNYLRHRALCLVFKEYPDNVDSLTVNHKNGIPGDDRLDNLEWVTRSENNTHAYVNDLKNQHKRILVRDVLSGKVTEYYSLSECARSLGHQSECSVLMRVNKSRFGQVFQDGTQVKLRDDPRDWIIPSDPLEEIKKARIKTPIIARDCKTRTDFLYSSKKEAQRATGINSSTIGWRISSLNKAPVFGWQFKSADDNDPFPDFTYDEYLSSLVPNDFLVEARNLLTLEEKTFSSIREAERELENSCISHFLRKGRQPLLESGWQIKYKQDTWEIIDDFETAIYRLQKTIMCKNEKTGEIRISDSAKKLGDTLGLDPKAIRTAAFSRGNRVYHGYRFRLGVSLEQWPS